MATENSTATSRFTTQEIPTDNLTKTAALMIECERLSLLASVNQRKNNWDTAEHIMDLYKVIGFNLALQQLRMCQ